MESQQKFGPFTLVKKLAEGGMAVTWLARVTGDKPGRELVIKRVLPKLSEDRELRALFVEESKVAKTLQHSELVETYDYGEIDGEHYLAMEFVWGEDLRRIAERGMAVGKFLPLRFVVKIIADAADGLHYFHNLKGDDGRPLGLVHRDVSPPNIMVTFDGDTKVVDFGIAKAESHYMNVRQGQLKGKFSYMSPEQVQGLEVDHRSDIFALGTILYELTTMKRLFKADSDVATIKLVSDAEFEAPHSVRSDYPPRLEEIVTRALAREPRDRYASAVELRDDLAAFLAENKIEPANDQIGSYLKEIFPDRIEELNELAGGTYYGPIDKPEIPSAAKAAPAPSGGDDILSDALGLDEIPPGREDIDTGYHEDDFIPDDEFAKTGSSQRTMMIALSVVVAILMVFVALKVFKSGFGTDFVDEGDYEERLAFEGSELPPPEPLVTTPVMVQSEPAGANIILNGIATGEVTPARVDMVQNSLNTVGLYMDGYETQVGNVEVAETASPASYTLVEIVQPEGWEPPPPVDPTTLPEGEEPPPPITEWTLPMGRIMIETRTPAGAVNGAEVLVNGVRQEGTTPIEIEVPAGQEQHITARLAGQRDSIGYVTAIPWESFEDTRYLTMELTADRPPNRYTTLRVDTVPDGATVLLDECVTEDGATACTGLEDQGARDLLNLYNPGHYVLQVEQEDHNNWVRAFDGGPGIAELIVRLQRPRSGPTLLTITVEGEGTNIYGLHDFAGSPGFTQYGRDLVEAREIEAGDYQIRLARRSDEGNVRVDLEHTFEPGMHYTMLYRLEGEEAVLVESTAEPVEEEEE